MAKGPEKRGGEAGPEGEGEEGGWGGTKVDGVAEPGGGRRASGEENAVGIGWGNGVEDGGERGRGRGVEEGLAVRERKEGAGRLNSSVILRIKRNPGLSVTVQYAEDGEAVEFERHESSEDQTESSEEEEEEEEEDDENETGEEEGSNGYHEQLRRGRPRAEKLVMTGARLKSLLERTRARRRAGMGHGGSNYWYAEGLYTVDGDYDHLCLPQLETARVCANRSILVDRMAKAALATKLPPSGLYLAVLLLDFYWDHDRAMGRRMDCVQLQVLAYTCLYVTSNRSLTSARTPDEFCRWAGVAERSVKGCMIIRQLDAFGSLLRQPENVLSVTPQSLWNHMTYLDPEEHMSKFITHLEKSEYGRTYFTAAVLQDAYDVKRQHNSVIHAVENAGKVMKRRLLFAATVNARTKRSSRDMSMDKAENSASNPAKLLCLQRKIAVL